MGALVKEVFQGRETMGVENDCVQGSTIRGCNNDVERERVRKYLIILRKCP